MMLELNEYGEDAIHLKEKGKADELLNVRVYTCNT
jgi:hypothetical protein